MSFTEQHLYFDDVQVGQPATWPWQGPVRKCVHPAPGIGVARMAGELGSPKKRGRIRHLLLRPAAVPI